MRKIFLIVLLASLSSGFSVTAQTYRLNELSSRLSTVSEDLAERIYNNYVVRSTNNRTDLENLMLAQQLSASANTFRRMVQDRRANAELSDAAAILLNFSRRFPTVGESSLYWRDARRVIDDVSREIQLDGSNGSDPLPEEVKDIIGQVRWRGTVDDEVQLYITNSTIDARTISGTTFPNGNYNFTSALPSNRRLTVGFNKLKGRGNIRVLQQPTKENGYTAVVQIKDNANGAKQYDLEIYWTR